MLKAELNIEYTAEMVRKGTSSRGDYEMVLLKSPGADRTRIPIWVQNVPSGVIEGSKFTIRFITGAGIRHIKPSEKFNKWQDEFSIDAIIQPV